MNDNRLIILQTACQLFSEQGYDAVGVQEIIATAGFTKPTLYHYFGSKQGLLDAILAHYLLPFNQQLTRPTLYHYFGSKQGLLDAILAHYLLPFNQQLTRTLHYQGDVQTSLRNIFNLYLDFAHHNARFFRLWMSIRLSHLADLLNFFQHVSTQHGNMLGRELILATSFQGPTGRV